MVFEFTGPLWYWRGPPPFYFITLPPAEIRTLPLKLDRPDGTF